MLSPPAELPEDALVPILASGWGLVVRSMTYRPVGFGSHHWEVVDADGARWFVNVDELATKRHSRDEPLHVTFGRLEAALSAVRALRDHGRTFAVAPVRTHSGELLVRASDQFTVAVYPFVSGQSFQWGEYSTPDHRRAVLDLVVGVHTAPQAVRGRAMVDDFAVPHRDELVAALHGTDDEVAGFGPYARPAAQLVRAHAAPVLRLLDRYDELVQTGRADASRAVLTHGEPHPGNTMLAADGWMLIDWDTTLLAPPERDLWSLAVGDGSVLDAYAAATGVTPSPAMLELYRLRWDLSDVAVDVSRFRRPHTGSRDDEKTWNILRSLLGHLSAG